MAQTFFLPGFGDVNLTPTWSHAGSPSSGTAGTLLGVAGKGDLLSDTSGAELYICTASSASSITWAEIAHA